MADFAAWCVPLLADDVGSREEAVVRPPAAGPRSPFEVRFPRWDTPALRGLVELLRDAATPLADRPVLDIASSLGTVGARFLDPDDPLRRRALELLPATAGVSAPMARAILDGMAADWTTPRLESLLEVDLGDASVLDGFVDRPGRGRVRALGAPFAVHLASGSVPGVSTTSLIRSLLVKTAVLLKPGRGDVVLPVLFLGALAESDPALAEAAAVLYWPGGEEATEDVVLAAADLVVAYGSDASVASVRRRLPPHVPLVRYHHRSSIAVVGREALAVGTMEGAAADAARAVALFDQRGCVSPQLFWVEEGGERSPRDFAGALARALDRIEEELPSGVLTDAGASALQQLRGAAELRAAAGEDIAVWSGGTTPWTVIYEGATGPGAGGGPLRFARVRPVADARRPWTGLLAPFRHHLQTVAVAGLGSRTEEVAELLARAGGVRVTSLERAPWPPPWWHHDGEGPLRSLIRWIDLEDC